MPVARWFAAVAAVLAASACMRGIAPEAPVRPSAPERLPVLLVVEGTAVDAAVTAEVAGTLSAHIGRPVVVAREPALDEGAERQRLAGTYGRLPPRGWADPRCAIGRAAAHALRYDADAYYRLHLDRTDHVCAATSEEHAAVPTLRRAMAATLRGIGLAPASGVHTVEVAGDLSFATFGPVAETRSVPLRASARAVDPLGRVRVDVRGAIADAIGRVTPPPFPHWSATARRQLATGCRLTALAIYDARLRLRADSRDVADRALGRARKRAVRPQGPTEPPAVAAPAEPPAAASIDARYTCRTLCELHMVELCNNDRDLWSRHQHPWESTPCGQRRTEAFLLDCYQRQWLSGTFEEACMAPCERAADGRARLLRMLQSGGCTRVSTL
jgi:hypothetical protein